MSELASQDVRAVALDSWRQIDPDMTLQPLEPKEKSAEKPAEPAGRPYIPAPRPEHTEPDQEPSAFERHVNALNGELLDTHGLSNIPKLEPLVDGFLYLNTTARVNGASGAMKSFVMLDLAAHVATGREWRGRKVKQGPVIYLVAEGAGGIEKRVRAWEQHHGVRAEGLYILPRPVQVKELEWQVLAEVCKRRGAVLIICDTQARITVGVEENSAKEMGVIVDRIETMRMATGACVALVHHQGVQGDRGRGSTSVKGAMQTELRVTRTGKGLTDTRITVISDKQKDDEEAADIAFSLEQQTITGMYKEDGTPITSVALVPADSGSSVQPFQEERKADTRVAAVLAAAQAPQTVKNIGDALANQPYGPLKERTIQNALKTLASQGIAKISGVSGYAQTWSLTETACAPVNGMRAGQTHAHWSEGAWGENEESPGYAQDVL